MLSPASSRSSVVLPAPLAPTRPQTLPSGISNVLSCSAHLRAEPLAQSRDLHRGGHAIASSPAARSSARSMLSMSGSVRPAMPRLGDPGAQRSG